MTTSLSDGDATTPAKVMVLERYNTGQRHSGFISGRSVTSVLVLLLASTVWSGCFYSREISRTRHDIERAVPGSNYHRGISMNLGPVSLHLARWILRHVDDGDALMASDYLSEVRRVKAGVYQVRDGHRVDVGRLPSLRRFERRGWELAVRVADGDESVLVYYRERKETVSDMFVVVASDEDLVIAKIEGRLNRLLEKAMQDHAGFTDLTTFGFND